MKKVFGFVCYVLFILQVVNAKSPIASAVKFLNRPVFDSGDTSKARDTTIVTLITHSSPSIFQNNIYKQRLDSIQKEIPLDYNEYVQNYIEIYSRNREEMGHVLGLTKYYFPIYEKAFHDAGIPEELKYLSIVESKLDPYAVSRVGATGPWQFMYNTAKNYGLNIDHYVDERKDPVQASYAAAAYLKEAYQKFGDWLVAIASYNCGPNNIERAIQRAGATDFWSIRRFLPAETRGYVPAFIAVTYLMHYYDKHNIIPQNCSLSLGTDTILVNKFVSLKIISKALDMDINVLCMLNPSYKQQILNGTDVTPRRLVIPQVDNEKYSALYDALNDNNIILSLRQTVYASSHSGKQSGGGNIPSFHKVRRGETLADIANNYGIEEHDLKVWNHLHGNKAVVGQRLKLCGFVANNEERPSKHHHNHIVYTVKSGDTLNSIASKFDGVSAEKIKSLNGLKKHRLQPGMTIRI